MKLAKSFVLLALLLALAVGALYAQFPEPQMDYRAERDFLALKQTLTSGSEREFRQKMREFRERYGFVAALAGLDLEWAQRQTSIHDAAVIYEEILQHWPTEPEGQEAARKLSELLLLARPWSLNDQLATLRGFSQRAIERDPVVEPQALKWMAKTLLFAEEPGQARVCLTAALSQSDDVEETDLRILRAETHRVAGDSLRATMIYEELLGRPLTTHQEQKVTYGLLRCLSPDDPRYEEMAERVRETAPDGVLANDPLLETAPRPGTNNQEEQ